MFSTLSCLHQQLPQHILSVPLLISMYCKLFPITFLIWCTKWTYFIVEKFVRRKIISHTVLTINQVDLIHEFNEKTVNKSGFIALIHGFTSIFTLKFLKSSRGDLLLIPSLHPPLHICNLFILCSNYRFR